MTLGGKLIENVKGIVAQVGDAGGTGSYAASERIVPVPQIDTYAELPFAPVEKADRASRNSTTAARAKPKSKVRSSKPSKPRKRQKSKSPKKRIAAK